MYPEIYQNLSACQRFLRLQLSISVRNFQFRVGIQENKAQRRIRELSSLRDKSQHNDSGYFKPCYICFPQLFGCVIAVNCQFTMFALGRNFEHCIRKYCLKY